MRSAGRKTRTGAHVRADIAVKYVEWICARAGFTTSATPAGADYGIDLLLQTFDGKGRVEAGEVKLQVKAVSRPRFVEGGERIACLVDKRDLELWLDHLFPVILVLYHPATATAYWVYVQQYFGAGRAFLLKTRARSRTIHCRVADKLTTQAVRRFAKWKNEIVARFGHWKLRD